MDLRQGEEDPFLLNMPTAPGVTAFCLLPRLSISSSMWGLVSSADGKENRAQVSEK